jgi:hypothetical protein
MQTLRVTGLDQGLSAALARWRKPRAIHDPGKIAADLAVTLACGGPDSGVRHESIDAPELLECGADRRIDVALNADVSRHGECTTSRLLDEPDGLR